MAKKKISTDDLKFDVEIAGIKIGETTTADGFVETGVQPGIPVEVKGLDGSKILMSQEEVIKGIANGSILSNSPNDFYMVATNLGFPDTTLSVVDRRINFPTITGTQKKVENQTSSNLEVLSDFDKFKEFEEETALIRKVIKVKGNKKKWGLEISEPVTLVTYKTLFEGHGDKMDIMQRPFVGGEPIELVGVSVPMDSPTPYRKYQFKLYATKTYFDLDEDRCYDYISNFEKVFESVEQKKAEIQKAKEKREAEERKRAEEEELQKIVAQAQRESKGSGIWS